MQFLFLLVVTYQHLKLSNLVGVELKHLKEVEEDFANEDLVLRRDIRGRVGEVALGLQTPNHEH